MENVFYIGNRDEDPTPGREMHAEEKVWVSNVVVALPSNTYQRNWPGQNWKVVQCRRKCLWHEERESGALGYSTGLLERGTGFKYWLGYVAHIWTGEGHWFTLSEPQIPHLYMDIFQIVLWRLTDIACAVRLAYVRTDVRVYFPSLSAKWGNRTISLFFTGIYHAAMLYKTCSYPLSHKILVIYEKSTIVLMLPTMKLRGREIQGFIQSYQAIAW